MQIIDFFKTGSFNLAEMTAAINVIPNQYGILGRLGIFSDHGITQRSAVVEYDNLTLNLLTSKPLGSPGDTNATGKRLVKSFAIPHFPFDDSMRPEDLQGRRAFGQVTAEDAGYVMNKKLTEMRNKHDQTLEWMRMGVLKGSITDGSANVILAPYTDFGLTQPVVAMALPTGSTEVLLKVLAVKRLVEAAVTGSSYTGITALCGSNFFDAFTTQATVKAAFANWMAMQNNYTDYRQGFVYGGVNFIEYFGSVPDSSGSTTALLDTDTAYAFPMGTNLFETFYAPGDFLDTVNTIGVPFYARQVVDELGRGVKVHTQSNPLPLCLKPNVIVKMTKV